MPACCRLCVYAPLLIALSIVYARLPAEAACINSGRLATFAVCTIALFALFCVLDVAGVTLALRTRFLQPSAAIIWVIYARILVFALHVANSIGGSIVVLSGVNDCSRSDVPLSLLCYVIVIVNWVVVALTLCGYYIAYDTEGHHTDSFASESKLENALHCITCSWFWRSDSSGVLRQPDVFHLIAKQMRTLFADAHGFVLSDLMMGLVLVRALQRRQRALGKRFLIALAEDNHKTEETVSVSGPASASVSASTVTSEAPALDVAQLAQAGVQPPLSEAAVCDLASARYYLRYAVRVCVSMLVVCELQIV